MRKLSLLLLFLSCCIPAIGQTYYPPYAVSAQNPSGQLVFVGADSSGNLYTNGTGSSGTTTSVSGYVPPVAMTGQNPSGVQVYLKTDANGNLYVNCTTGCSGGGGGYTIQIAGVSLTAADTINFNVTTPAAPSNGANVTFATSKVSTTDSVSAAIIGDGTSTHYLSGVGTWTTPSGGGGGGAFPQTVSGTTTSGGVTYFSSTTVLSSSGILNSNILVKGGGAGGAPTNSSITDNGTTVTTTDTGGFVGPSFTFNGTTAGFYDFPQGSTSSGVAPCNTANSICIQAPSSVTAYVMNLPPAQPAANNNFMSCTAANPTVCSFVQILWSQLGNASGNLTLANGTNTTEFDQTSAANWTWANITAASSGAQKQAPIFNFCGQAWEGGSLANTQSCFTMQQQFCSSSDCTNLNTNNATPHLVIQNADATTTNPHNIAVRLQGVDIFFDASKNNMNIGANLGAPAGTQIVAIGHGTLPVEATNGGGDVVIGYTSMTNANGDSQNTVVGSSAGNSCTGCVGVSLLGYSANAGAGSSYSEGWGDNASISGSITNAIVIGTSQSVSKSNETVIGNSSTLEAYVYGVIHGSNSVALSSPITITSLTFVTTSLVLPAVPISTTLRGSCSIIWEQSTGTNTVQFGIGMNNAPTDLYVMNTLHSGASGGTIADQYTTITGTSTTAISATGAPGATATGYKEEIEFTIITGGTNTVVVTIYGLTGNASDALVVEPGSSCGWLP